jgi:hypothetical protein
LKDDDVNLADSLSKRASESRLAFWHCSISDTVRDAAAYRFFDVAFQNPSKVTHLFFGPAERFLVANFLAYLRRQIDEEDSNLKDLQFINDCRLDFESFSGLLALLKRNLFSGKLVIEDALDQEMTKKLIGCLPKIRDLKCLKLHFGDDVAPLKDEVMAAFRNNLSLEDVDVQAQFMKESDLKILKSLCERNAAQRLAVERAKECGSAGEMVYRMLLEYNDTLLPNPGRM